MLGLAACDAKPPEQASRDVDQIVNRAPSPAAGQDSTAARADATGSKDSQSTAGTQSAATPASPQATPATDDVAINIKVQDALKSDFTLKAQPIIVQTTEGVVTLSGSADTPAHRDQATQIAMGVAGVKSVQNKLTVSGT